MFCGPDSCYDGIIFPRCLSWLYVFVGISTICNVPICVFFFCGQDLLLGALVVIVEVTSVLRLRMHIVPEITCFCIFGSLDDK